MIELGISFLLMFIKFIVAVLFIKGPLLKKEKDIFAKYMMFMFIKDFFIVALILVLIKMTELDSELIIAYMMLFYFVFLAVELFILNKTNNKLNQID